MKLRLLLFAYFSMFFVACAKVKDPEFRRLENFSVKNFDLQQVAIGFKVTYFNPNNFGVTVKEAAGDVYLDSVFIGKFNQDREVEVAKNSEFSIPFSGAVPLSTVLKLKVNDLSNRELLVRADGSVRVGKAGVFVNRPFKYSGKHKVDLKL